MGCGLSTMDATKNASKGLDCHRSNQVCQHASTPPVIENKKYCNNDDGRVVVVNEEAKTREEGLTGEGSKEKSMVDGKEEGEEMTVFLNERQGGQEEHVIRHVQIEKEENNKEEYKDDSFIGQGSPSFKDYCNDYDSVDRNSMINFNNCDSGESTKNNSSDDDSSYQLKNEKNDNSKKEPKKKDRKARGFRNVMNTGKQKRKRNLLSFGCYNSSSESYAEGSFNNIVEKTA